MIQTMMPKVCELNQRATARQKVTVHNAGDRATIYLYDYIGYDGIVAKDFVPLLNSIAAPQIDLRVNSPGGDVFEGRAIATAVAQHSSRITTYIDSVAASAASWIALKSAEVVIAQGAFLMIHNTHGFAAGDKHTMRALSDLMDKLDRSFADDYAAKTGRAADEFAALMDAEEWFDAAQAVAAGMADRIGETTQTKNQWDLSAYKNAPRFAPARNDVDDAREKRARLAAESAARHRHLTSVTMGFAT